MYQDLEIDLYKISPNSSLFLDVCPFCGTSFKGDAREYVRYYTATPEDSSPLFYVNCESCGMKGPSSLVLEEAVSFWNNLPRELQLNWSNTLPSEEGVYLVLNKIYISPVKVNVVRIGDNTLCVRTQGSSMDLLLPIQQFPKVLWAGPTFRIGKFYFANLSSPEKQDFYVTQDGE